MRVGRFELVLIAASFAGWILAFVHHWGWVSLAGMHALGLYSFYSVAAIGGWLLGNIRVYRKRRLGPSRRLTALYLLGPPGLLNLIWAMGPVPLQVGAPMVPVYAFGVFALFFLVPTTLNHR